MSGEGGVSFGILLQSTDMFAVPGWSLSADSLRPQTQSTSKVSEENTRSASNGPLGEKSTPTRKRKRGTSNSDNAKVTGQNLAELWQKHIEHKTTSTTNKSIDAAPGVGRGGKKRKRPKEESEDTAAKGGANQGEDATLDGKTKYLKRKTLKEKRREKKAQMQANGEAPPSRSKPTETTDNLKPIEGQNNADRLPEKHSEATDVKAMAAPVTSSNMTPLQLRMRQKLISARFRHLNQTLYDTLSTHSFELFKENPTFFTEYHDGFQRQVEAWPENPVEGFIQWIKERGSVDAGGRGLGSQKSMFKKNKKGQKPTPPTQEPPQDSNITPLPRHPSTHLSTIADLGCGTAILSRTLSPLTKSLNLKIHSFDLCAPDPCTTVADIRSLPLADSSVDVAIFCLALMGTNWLEFIEEAWRILRWKGECWIGEVGSRFVSATGIKAERVAHSVGNRKKGGGGKKNDKKKEAGNEESLLHDDNAVELDAESSSVVPASGSINTTTDLAPFISVLRARGFVLAGEPELGNKMFVRMRFVKGLTPTRGKCVPPVSRNEQEGKRPRFLEKGKDKEKERGAGDVPVEVEGKVLKGCVYKNR